MVRYVAILALALGIAAEAWADIPPPPPPAGQKYVSVVNEVRLGKEFPDYVFVVAEGMGPGPPRYVYKKIELGTKSAQTLPAGGRYRYIELLAVPHAAAGEVLADRPGFAAPGFLKIAGLHRLGFGDTQVVDQKHPGNSVTRKHTITELDPNGGIKTTVEREPADAEAERKTNQRSEAGPGGTSTAVAGIALALSFAVGGIWLARNRRAKTSNAGPG